MWILLGALKIQILDTFLTGEIESFMIIFQVLYFQPGAVYTPAFDEIIKQTFNPELKAMFQAFVDNKEIMCQTGDHIGRVLGNKKSPIFLKFDYNSP